MTRAKRITLWTIGALLAPLVLVALIVVVLYLPPVQRWATGVVADKASKATGWQVTLDALRITWPLDVDLRGLAVVDNDTILSVESLIIDLDFGRITDWKIGVEAIDLHQATLNTQDLIASMTLSGHVGDLHLSTENIDIKNSDVGLASLSLSNSDIDIALRDTTIAEEDEEESEPLAWVVRVSDVSIENTSVAFHSAGDTLSVGAKLNGALLQNAVVDLATGRYTVEQVDLGASVEYHQTYEPAVSTLFDYNHIAADSVQIALRDVVYCPDSLSLWLDAFAARERSGLTVSEVQTRFLMKGDELWAQDLMLLTPNTEAFAQFYLNTASGAMEATLRGSVGMGDASLFAPSSVHPYLPLAPVRVEAKATEDDYRCELSATDVSGGQLQAMAHLNMTSEAYEADIDVDGLRLGHYVQADSLGTITMHATVEGQGLDFSSHSTWANALIDMPRLTYADYQARALRLDAHLANGWAKAELTSALEAMGIKLRLDARAQSNMSNDHSLRGSLTDIFITDKDSTEHQADDLLFGFHLAPDTLAAGLQAGDFILTAGASHSIDGLLAKIDALQREIDRQTEGREIDQLALRALLPTMHARIECGTENPVIGAAKAITGFEWSNIEMDLDCTPLRGFGMRSMVQSLNTGAVMIDTIRLGVMQDSLGVLNLRAHVENNEKNRQVVFATDLRASLAPRGLKAEVEFRDDKHVTGLRLGAELEGEEDGLRLHLTPLDPIVAYRNFKLNEDNFVFIGRDNSIEADVDLVGDDSTRITIFTTPNAEASQDLTLQIRNLNLAELTQVIPYCPSVRGWLGGDFHLVMHQDQISLAADTEVKRLVYEGAPLGNVGLNLMYTPGTGGAHIVDGSVRVDSTDVLLLSGTYANDRIEAMAELRGVPASLANGFLGETASLIGLIDGHLQLIGPLASPNLNGTLSTRDLNVSSAMYSLSLTIPDDTLRVTNNLIDLGAMRIYSTGKEPLILSGTVDCRDLSDPRLDVSLNAEKFELINAPKSLKAVAYGKVLVNLRSKLTGPTSDLKLRGALTVLGGTDVTYVLSDSPLTVEDELAGLVEFCDFSDTTAVDTQAITPPSNLDMRMAITIEQSAGVHCLLSADGTSYVNLEGGGDFTLLFTTLEGLRLFGRYTVISGDMTYTMMVLNLTNCAITPGSFVEFTGDALDPTLSLTATERVKTTVTENETPRSVNFDVGVSISQTLENMGLEFTLDAPDDLSISNQLASMSAESRGKAAVTMLVTGMYLTDESDAEGFSGTNAMNAFLASKISALSNKALSSVDLNLSMDMEDDQTDYNFSFAKHFWGNRISLIIGGKVSSGAEAENTGNSIINNVSVEYRLDNSATRYVRLYYDRSTESLMEGEITEMGGGIVFRKKASKLGELFIFKKKEKK